MIKKIFIHPIYRCNAKCIHCAVPKSKKILSFEDFKKIVEISKKNNVEYLIIGGGEPLLYPNIIDMVKYAHKNGIKVKIETNGKLLTKELLDEIKKYIFQFNISLDGLNPKTHNSIRNLDTFHSTVNSITYARKIGIDIAIWSVVMKRNISELKDIFKLLEKMKVNKISFMYATPVGECYKNKENILVDTKKYYLFMKNVKSKNRKIQIRIEPYLIPFDRLSEFKKYLGSELPKTDCMIYDKEVIHIDPEGNIFPCVLLLSDKKFCLGNVNNNDDLSDILDSKKNIWDGIMKILYEHKRYAEKNGYSGTGCIGICNSFKVNLDPRFKKGIPICPCRTISKEWNFKNHL